MAEPHGDSPRSPVSRTVTVSTLPTGGFPVRIDATAEERGELAEAHGLSSVESFHADLELKRWRKDGVRMRGTIRAEIVQECIVTLEPVVSKLDIPVDAVFLPEDSPLRRPLDDDGALIVDPETARSMPARSRRNSSNWPSIPIRGRRAPNWTKCRQRTTKATRMPMTIRLPGWRRFAISCETKQTGK